MEIVATTSLPAVDRPNADRWNATRSCQSIKVRNQVNLVHIINLQCGIKSVIKARFCQIVYVCEVGGVVCTLIFVSSPTQCWVEEEEQRRIEREKDLEKIEKMLQNHVSFLSCFISFNIVRWLLNNPVRLEHLIMQSTYFRIQTQNGKIQTNYGPDFKRNSD